MAHWPDLDVRSAGLRVFLATHTAGDVVTKLDLAMAVRLAAIAAAHDAASECSGRDRSGAGHQQRVRLKIIVTDEG